MPEDLALRVADELGRGEWVWCARACTAVRVNEIDGKGLGAIACRSFASGEAIFAERPLVEWLQSIDASKPENLLRLEAAVEMLDAASRVRLDALTQNTALYGERKTVLGIFLSNAYSTDDAEAEAALARSLASGWQPDAQTEPTEPTEQRSALFALISRFNHSCAPNTEHTWQRREPGGGGARVVRATRAIPAGEELTVNYIGEEATGHPSELRRAYLRAKFGFECTCPLCAY